MWRVMKDIKANICTWLAELYLVSTAISLKFGYIYDIMHSFEDK